MMKRNILLGFALMAPFTASYATPFSVTVDASQYTGPCANNSILVAKALYPAVGGSQLLIDPALALCDYNTRPKTIVLLYDTDRMSGYPYLIVSSKHMGAVVLQHSCLVSQFKPAGSSIDITIKYNGRPDPVYSVECN